MFGSTFYNQTTRRYVSLFGTLFNDITIERKDVTHTNTVQRMKVPINYGPMQKFLAKIEQDPDLAAPAISLPRMSFELTTMAYDGERKLTPYSRFIAPGAEANSLKTVFSPTPYNMEFQLNIMTKYQEDGTKIIEQILPYFKPDFTVSAKLLDDMPDVLDIPVILNSISSEDTYDSTFDERRALIWTLMFTVKGYFFGPRTNKKIIKFATVNTYIDMPETNPDPAEIVTVQPGLTANGEPTTDINETIDWSLISIDDDWAYIVRIEDYEG